MRKAGRWTVLLLLIGVLLISAANGETAAGADRTFESLQTEWNLVSAENVAFIEIPGSSIIGPVMRSEESDDFYLLHDAYGADDRKGTFYVEKSGNSAALDENAVVIFGRRLNDGNLFGSLQAFYSYQKNFEENNRVLMYTPEGKRTYIVFAALTFPNEDIIADNNFQFKANYNVFFNKVFSERALFGKKDVNLAPVFGDQVLVLSTTVKGNANKRFLVLAKRVEG